MTDNTQNPKMKISLVTLTVPAGIIIAALLPLRPLVQQALVGIALVWFYLVYALGLIKHQS